MREWNLPPDGPLTLRFAADARLKLTDYADDQSWEIALGTGDEPALSFNTRYGGRVGLSRIVPMWYLDGRAVYTAVAMRSGYTLKAFAPNYARLSAALTDTLQLVAELFVVESRGVAGLFTLENTGSAAQEVRLELAAQAVRDVQPIPMNALMLEDGTDALHMGKIGNLDPVLMLAGAKSPPVSRFPGTTQVPKLVLTLNVPAGGKARTRWAHAGRDSVRESLRNAHHWLTKADLDAERARIDRLDAHVPHIETGRPDWDAALAFSAAVVLRSFIGPTSHLPYPSLVTARTPGRGYSPRGDGSDHAWQWSGQTAYTALLTLPSAAILAPDLAAGVVRNALAVRGPDGYIDFKPGLGGQRARQLSAPLWASIAWAVYEQTEDRALIAEALPALRTFFERWFAKDADADGDGFPEWANTQQSGYNEHPIFARFRRWAENADIHKAEAPDLAAYLIAEGRALQKMADLIGDQTGMDAVQKRVAALEGMLPSLWNAQIGNYQYRDRDTDQAVKGVNLFRGKGDEPFDVRTPLTPANRLILRVVGGRDTAPRFSVVVEGVNAKGQHVSETLSSAAFAWHMGMGAAVTENVYSQINYIKFEGLIRLFSVEIDTADLSRDVLFGLMPLWAGIPDVARAADLHKTLTDPARYWRPHGIPVTPATDEAFAPNNDGGSGGVFPLWNVMLIDGLLHYGYTADAATLFTRLLENQIAALRGERAFREFYNSETGAGLGDVDELAGVVPLATFFKLIGLRVVSERRIWAGGTYALPLPEVAVTVGGTRITRRADGTSVAFASGQTVSVGADWQLIEDPTPVPTAPPPAPTPSPDPAPQPSMEESQIAVEMTKDKTMEIPVAQIDFTPKPPSPPAPPAGTVKIPVTGAKRDEPPAPPDPDAESAPETGA